jgi:hypothetical protein
MVNNVSYHKYRRRAVFTCGVNGRYKERYDCAYGVSYHEYILGGNDAGFTKTYVFSEDAG